MTTLRIDGIVYTISKQRRQGAYYYTTTAYDVIDEAGARCGVVVQSPGRWVVRMIADGGELRSARIERTTLRAAVEAIAVAVHG